MKKVLVAAVALGLVASVGMADVTLSYDPSTINPGEATDIAVSLIANPGAPVSVGAMGFDYDGSSDAWTNINPTGFSWTPATVNDPNSWFATSDLPNPQAVAFFPGAAIDVPDGAGIEIATLSVNAVDHAAVTEYSFAANMTVADENVSPLNVKGGDPATITVTPEPTTLGLLAIGALAVVRRKRR